MSTSLHHYLKKISFNSVLEFGCGYGRITKLILDNFSLNYYTAFDVSPHQLYNAKKECSDHKLISSYPVLSNLNQRKKLPKK